MASLTKTTWDPTANTNMVLSNHNLTATDPGSKGQVQVEATTAIVGGEKVYFETTTSGFYAGSGANIGVATKPWDLKTDNFDPNPNPDRVDPFPRTAESIGVAWDGIVEEGGNFITSNPHRFVDSYQNFGTLDIAVDTVDNKFWWRSSLTNQWDESRSDNPATNTGGFSITPLIGDTLYPMVSGWTGAGTAVTLNGGAAGFTDKMPAGFTALDNLGSSAPPADSGDTVVVDQPATLAAGATTITGTESDATQAVWVDWRTSGVPQSGDADWVQAKVSASGSFTATVTIDQPGTASTMYYRVGNGPAQAAWTATPDSSGSTTGPVVTPPTTGDVTIGSGSDTLALQVSEDAWNGDAQFTVAVDGEQIGGTQTATAAHSQGDTQTFDVMGDFTAGNHQVTVDFLNDVYGGSKTADRNLYVRGATIDGDVVSGATLSEHANGPQSFSFIAPGNSGSNTGDTVSVDHPTNLAAGVITGTESDPSQSLLLDWRTFGTPSVGDADWIQATVDSAGRFTASLNVDHPGVSSTLYYRVGSGPAIAAWSDTP